MGAYPVELSVLPINAITGSDPVTNAYLKFGVMTHSQTVCFSIIHHNVNDNP